MKKLFVWIKNSPLLFLIVFVAIICVIMLLAYFITFHGKPSDSSTIWGNFGDYFGSITGLLAFVGVLYSLELSERRAEEAKSRELIAEEKAKVAEKKAEEEFIRREERDLFFKLQALEQEKFNAVVINYNEQKASGLNAFDLYINIANNIIKHYYINWNIVNMKSSELIQIYDANSPCFSCSNFDRDIMNECETVYKYQVIDYSDYKVGQKIEFDKVQKIIQNDYTDIKSYDINTDKIKYSYSIDLSVKNLKYLYSAIKLVGNFMNANFGHILGQYYRNMFYVLDTCSKFKFESNYYLKLYRAQLSRKEMLLCLFFVVSDKSSADFAKIIFENKILDDLYFEDFFLTKSIDNKGNELEFVNLILKEYLEEHSN